MQQVVRISILLLALCGCVRTAALRSTGPIWIRTEVATGPDSPEVLERVPPQAFLVVRRSMVMPVAPILSDADVNSWPFETVGKLTIQGAARTYCSAQFVGSSDVLLTAAHCLHDGSGWILNPSTGKQLLKFHRALHGVSFAQFVPTTCAAVSSHWPNVAGGDPAYDYAFIRTAVPSNAGFLTLRLGVPYASWSAVGYPFDYKNGYVLAAVQGTAGAMSAREVEMLLNPMEKGASGGAWIGDLSPSHTGNEVIGLNSSRYGTSMMSPLFTSETLDLYSFVARGCPP